MYILTGLNYIIEVRRSGALPPRWLLPLSLHLVNANRSLPVVGYIFLDFPPVPKSVGALPLWVSPVVVLGSLQ